MNIKRGRVALVCMLLCGTALVAQAELLFEVGAGGDVGRESVLFNLDVQYSFLEKEGREILYLESANDISFTSFATSFGIGVRPVSFIDIRGYGGIELFYPNTLGSRAHNSPDDYTVFRKQFVEGNNTAAIRAGGELAFSFEIGRFTAASVFDLYYADYTVLSSQVAPRAVDSITELGVPSKAGMFINNTRLSYRFEKISVGVENIFYTELSELVLGDLLLSYLSFEQAFGKTPGFTFFLDINAGIYIVHPVHKTFNFAGSAVVGIRYSLKP